MALVNRNILSIKDNLPNLLTYLKNYQRGIISEAKVVALPKTVDWEIVNSPDDNNYTSVCYSVQNKLFVGVCSSGSSRVITSVSGRKWSQNTGYAYSWFKICCGQPGGKDRFVAVSSNAAGSKIMWSDDGFIWYLVTPPTTNNLTGVTWGNSLFVAVADSGTDDRVITSPTGAVWTARDTTGLNDNWQDITHYNKKFIAVSDFGTYRVMNSVDAINWTGRITPQYYQYRSVSGGGGKYVMVSQNAGTNNGALYSDDGDTWYEAYTPVANLRCVRFHNGVWVVVGQGVGGITLISYDAKVWYELSHIKQLPYFGLGVGDNKFVGVAAGVGAWVDRILCGEIVNRNFKVDHNWVWKIGSKIYVGANTHYYDGSWNPSDSYFKDVTVLKLVDSFVTAGIAIGESGETVLDGFIATSIVGALNELKREGNNSEWFRTIIDGTHSFVYPKFLDSTVVDFSHMADGLMDAFAVYTGAITIGESGETSLNAWYNKYSLFGCFNKLAKKYDEFCRAERDTSVQSISATTLTTIIFNSAVDGFADSPYSVSTGVFTVKEAGVYIIQANICAVPSGTNSGITVKIKQDTNVLAKQFHFNSTTHDSEINFNAKVRAYVDDEIYVEVYTTQSMDIKVDEDNNFKIFKQN